MQFFCLSAMVATTYFRVVHYHRPWSISLLCSKWEQVGQLQYNRHHRTQYLWFRRLADFGKNNSHTKRSRK